MDCDELTEQMLQEETTRDELPKSDNNRRERLIALIAGGKGGQYLGSSYTTDKIDKMTDDEVDKLYARYEARLGAVMTKTLGSSVLQLFASIAGMLLPIPPDNQSKLVQDLDEDPFVGHALSTACCELYHKYGMFLAPLTAAITTAKYCQFRHKSNTNNIDGSCTTTAGSCITTAEGCTN